MGRRIRRGNFKVGLDTGLAKNAMVVTLCRTLGSGVWVFAACPAARQRWRRPRIPCTCGLLSGVSLLLLLSPSKFLETFAFSALGNTAKELFHHAWIASASSRRVLFAFCLGKKRVRLVLQADGAAHHHHRSGSTTDRTCRCCGWCVRLPGGCGLLCFALFTYCWLELQLAAPCVSSSLLLLLLRNP